MDDDVLRRGKPTCHIAFGEATALLAGDALQSCAFEVLVAARLRERGQAVLLLAQAVGSRGMAGGQEIDLAAVGQSLDLAELEHMHALKTSALIRAAVCLGADCGRPMSADENDALHRYASAIGLAFQVVDDVLDVEGTAQSLGKTAGKDAVQRKSTYVTLMGLAAARERIETLRVEARTALADLGMAQQMIADNEIDLAATRALLLRACEELDAGHRAAHETSIAKTFAAEALYRVVDRAVQPPVPVQPVGSEVEGPVRRAGRVDRGEHHAEHPGL